jgi:hypothetical protein
MGPHLLRVVRPVVKFEELIAAVRHGGGRVGWLELSELPPAPVPEALEAAAERGVLRAVAVGGGRSVAVKPMRGPAVLRDLLREHFRGCALVLARGEVEAPLLEPEGEGWTVAPEGRAATRWTTEELAAALRKPHPWGDGAAA